ADEFGTLAVNGEANLDQQAVKANVQVNNLPAAGANLLLPNSLGIRSGVLDANLTAAAAMNEDGALDESAVDVKGTARFREGVFLASALPAPVSNVQSQLVFKGRSVSLEETSLQLNDTVLTATGAVDWEKGYDLTAQIPEISVAEVQALANVDLPVAVDGAFRLDVAVAGELEKPTLAGKLASLQPLVIDQLALAAVSADFGLSRYVEGNRLPTRFDLNELRARPQAGGLVVATGQADLTDLENPIFQLVADADLPADALALTYGVELPEDVVLGNLTAEIQAGGDVRSQTAFAQWQLAESTFPGTGEITLVDNLVALDNTRLQVAGGTATAEALLELESRDWQAAIAAEQIAVEQFTTQAQGLLSADIEAAGNLNTLDLNAIEAKGTALIADAQIQLSQTSEPLLDRGDWTTAFRWEGNAIAVESFSAPGVQADGTIGIDLARPKLIDALNLNVALRSVNLQPLNSFAPPSLTDYGQVSGLASFDGQLVGTLENPQIAGEARLDGLAANELLFEPLRGPIAFSLAEGGRVDLQGQQDRLQVALRDTPGESLPYWPVSFAVQNQEFVATGYSEGRLIHADVVQLPLSALNVQPAPQYGLGTVAGSLTASIDVNLADFNNPTAAGSLTIAQPSLSPVDAEQFTASFAYANRTARLTQGELLFDDSRYLLAGSANLDFNNLQNTQYEGMLTIAEGRIEDIVPIVKQLDLSQAGLGDAPTPLGSAADLATEPAGLPPVDFLAKLDSFVAFLAAHPETASDEGELVLPALDDLNGEFTGTVAVAGRSLSPSDITADFTVQGDSWQWGQYTEPNEFAPNEFAPNEFAPNEFVLDGEFEQNRVEIETAYVNAGETQIDLSGSGNLDTLDGQLTVDSLPVELAGLIYPLPADVEGDLNLVTTFDGSLANPVVVGEARVVDTQVNGYAIDQVAADFDYRNAVLNLNSEIAIAPTEPPITITGNIPYALPLTTVVPPTDQIALRAVVSNRSFEIVNALTNDQVRWQSGQGEVVVQVGGTLAQPLVNGQASFINAAISSSLVRESITDLTGNVRFTLDQVNIPQLQANVGDGRLSVTGSLPLLSSGESILAQVKQQAKQQAKQADARPPQDTDGLLVAVEAVPIDFENILQAVFDGQVLVTGAVLSPTISGNIEIDDGQVQANQLLSQVGTLNLPTTEELAETSPYRVEYLGDEALETGPNERPIGILDRLTLQNFGLSFGDRLAIIGQPFYNISAIGALTVNGPLSAPQPIGTIELSSGWINLFSTQFRLDASAPNTATFTPEGGIDPFVDVVMKARVQDADITPAPTPPGGFATADVNEATVDTIGNVEYVSVQAVAMGPASELADSLTLTSNSSRNQGELLALLGSSVFSGVTSASLTNVAGFLGGGTLATFGDRIADAVGLRSFSVFPTTDTGDDSSVGIGIGVEASAAIGDRFSANVLEILNSSNPPQLGVQYRLTDEFELRGASNLDETEFELEYRIEF
ncbi:MAG: translocation/assembly module TamB domain-containing protein, partial [Phormidesmis sp.]